MAETKDYTKSIGIIILAAGSSSRLGTPKQLLIHAGKTLLQHSIEAAIDSIADPVIVVLGAHENDITKNMERGNAAHWIANPNWQEGMASSIRCGINTLLQVDPLTEGTVIMLCDQPYVSTSLLNNLLKAYQATGKPIIASSYNGIFGVPALFQKSVFPELLQLRGDVGARSIVQQYANEVELIVFSKGSVDIDTAADYQELSKHQYKE